MKSPILRSLCKENSVSTIRHALVLHWLEINDLADYPLRDLCLPEHLFTPQVIPNSSLRTDIKKIYPSYSLKDLENSLETLLEYQHKRQTGIVLTPSFIVDYLIRTAADLFSFQIKKPPVICDPACGYGGFLIPAIKYLSSSFSISFRDVVSRHIYGFDINPDSISVAKIIISLFILQSGSNPKDLTFNIHQADSLFDNLSAYVTEKSGFNGFDILVTNPPYIKLQNLSPSYRTRLIKEYKNFSTGSFSTAMLFLIAGYNLLSPTGYLGYITQNNLFTSLAGLEVRRFLQGKECIRRIIDFGHAKVFSNASAYTCLIFLSRSPSPLFEYGRLHTQVDAVGLTNLSYSELSHKSLSQRKWRLVSIEHTDNIKKLESIGTSLGSLYAIRVGFATLKDRAYLVHKTPRGVESLTPEGNLRQIEYEVTRPAIKIAEFSNEKELLDNQRRIIFPYEKNNKYYKPISEGTLKKQYPQCYSYLLSWKAELEERDKGKRNIQPWYAWGRSQSMDAPGPKLLTKTFSAFPNFLYDESDSLFCNGYAVFARHQSATLLEPPYSMRILQIILNSALLDYFLRLTSFQIEGNYQCYQKNFIERFSLPRLTKADMSFLVDCPKVEKDKFLCQKYEIDYSIIQAFLAENL